MTLIAAITPIGAWSAITPSVGTVKPLTKPMVFGQKKQNAKTRHQQQYETGSGQSNSHSGTFEHAWRSLHHSFPNNMPNHLGKFMTVIRAARDQVAIALTAFGRINEGAVE